MWKYIHFKIVFDLLFAVGTPEYEYLIGLTKENLNERINLARTRALNDESSRKVILSQDIAIDAEHRTAWQVLVDNTNIGVQYDSTNPVPYQEGLNMVWTNEGTDMAKHATQADITQYLSQL